MIYHATVPDECPPLNDETEYGLASPIEFSYPAKSEVVLSGVSYRCFQTWTLSTYQAFDISKSITPDFHAPKKTGKIPLVREEKVYETDKDPANLSGCMIS